MRGRVVATAVGLLVGLVLLPGPALAGQPDRAEPLVVPAAGSGLPATWRERFVVRYGPGRRLLGTAPGGDAGSLDIGPEYGAPAPDGSWWFLDAAKRRLAHYDADGRYLGRVRVPRRLLVSGRYFQWQLPHVLRDGTLYAARQTARGTALLRLRHGVVDEVPLARRFLPSFDDGRRLYGSDGRGAPAVADPRTGAVRPAQAFRTPSGTRFRLSVGRRLRVELPGAGVAASYPLRTASGARAHVSVQVRAGADDVLHLFLVGLGADDESVQLVGATSTAPGGGLGPVEALPDPFNEADPGSPAQLAMRPGSSTPALVYVLPDGVHVYERSAA